MSISTPGFCFWNSSISGITWSFGHPIHSTSRVAADNKVANKNNPNKNAFLNSYTSYDSVDFRTLPLPIVF